MVIRLSSPIGVHQAIGTFNLSTCLLVVYNPRPEHSLASYELAMDMGADFVEFDIVSTKVPIHMNLHH
jgi:hypothetical protein